MELDGPWQDAARGAGLWADGHVAPTVFARMSALAAQLGAMNLGQGFPDTSPPALVAETARAAIADGENQYPRDSVASSRARPSPATRSASGA